MIDEVLRDRLRHAYAQPPRWYHTFDHATAVAGRVEALGGNRACLLAAWAHDVVYRPGQPDNEQDSARWLRAAIPDDPHVAEAARLIRVTATHDPVEGDVQAEILCDADLATLGGSPAAYQSYVTAVRQEFAHIDEASWQAGRARVLRQFLDRPTIFRTEEGQARWEADARRNIAAELAALSGDDAGQQP